MPLENIESSPRSPANRRRFLRRTSIGVILFTRDMLIRKTHRFGRISKFAATPFFLRNIGGNLPDHGSKYYGCVFVGCHSVAIGIFASLYKYHTPSFSDTCPIYPRAVKLAYVAFFRITQYKGALWKQPRDLSQGKDFSGIYQIEVRITQLLPHPLKNTRRKPLLI